jgi:hypothetical protein
MTTWRRLWDGLRRLGHALFYAVMICVFVSFIVMGIIGWVERDRPVYWGTFTETSSTCDPGPRGTCTSVGRWLSTDRTIVKDGVTLDGVAGADGVVRASYQPGGPMGDDENNVVHTAIWSTAGLWFPWAAASLTAGAILYYHRQWRRVGGKEDRSPPNPFVAKHARDTRHPYALSCRDGCATLPN